MLFKKNGGNEYRSLRLSGFAAGILTPSNPVPVLFIDIYWGKKLSVMRF